MEAHGEELENIHIPCAWSGKVPNAERRESQDTVEMKMHMDVFLYDLAFNLIAYHICPYKYLYKHAHKSFFCFKYAKWPHSTLYKFADWVDHCVLTFASFCTCSWVVVLP
jgi:hypothetical protein